MAQLGALVKHRLPLGIVHVLLFNFVEIEEPCSTGQVIRLDGLPEGLVQAPAILLKSRRILIKHFGFFSFFAGTLHFLQRAVESL